MIFIMLEAMPIFVTTVLTAHRKRDHALSQGQVDALANAENGQRACTRTIRRTKEFVEQKLTSVSTTAMAVAPAAEICKIFSSSALLFCA
jgi:hypothetical protein